MMMRKRNKDNKKHGYVFCIVCKYNLTANRSKVCTPCIDRRDSINTLNKVLSGKK